MNLADQEMSGAQIAQASGRTERWVRQLAARGVIERTRRGHYSTASVLRGLTRHFEEQIAAREVPTTRQRIDEAKAREVEMRIAEKERKLISQAEAQGAITRVVAEVEADLGALHLRFKEPARSLIRGEALASLARIKSAEAKLINSLVTGDEIGGAL
ncbi:hypothetical protein BMI86_00060 [Thioclava sp. DLFJ5-1]|uniref:hypothetical protein n=1 Tax=Thioclava sp. DLFJ5-1 TaxID=1915314 RepID=UPI00099627BF|nr:hypothetical protein [Thioclava sp. DLFJ5-1]OOY21029.1 hypothetical protein BMI86_00060 [Thioclava sp. DLFJ5-1]